MLHIFASIDMDINQIYQIFKSNGFGFTSDSRKVSENDIFFALKGPSFNGNAFAAKALEDGAAYAIVDEEEYAIGDRYILVDDALECMQELATMHRLEFPIPFIAIGGSNGKTSSKELIRHVLSQKYNVHWTLGNFNNLIGVPLTLLSLKEGTDIAVVEIGTNSFGEIEQLCRIVKPTHGVITNIGKEHLEGFGDLEGVAREESELYLYLHKNQGTAFVNSDDEWLMRMASRLEHTFTYGKNGQVQVDLIESMPHLKMKYLGLEITSSLFGEHNFQNASLAIAIGAHFGLTPDQIRDGIASYVPDNNRSQIVKAGSNTLILDAYNANPSSVESVLASFTNLAADASAKVIVLGDMFELGDKSREEHKNMLEIAAKMDVANVYLVGERFMEHSSDYDFKFFDNVQDLNTHLESNPIDDSHVLVKGSRGVKLEQLSIIPE